MKRLFKWLDLHFEETLLGALLVLICGTIFLQVVMRYVLKSALPWPEEFTRYCLVCSTLLSLSYCIRGNIMLKVDLLVRRLPRLLQAAAAGFVNVVSLGVYLFLFLNSITTTGIARASMQLSTAMQMPMYLLYGWGSVCFALATLRMAQKMALETIGFVRELQHHRGGKLT